jgi:hypothetical protein
MVKIIVIGTYCLKYFKKHLLALKKKQFQNNCKHNVKGGREIMHLKYFAFIGRNL